MFRWAFRVVGTGAAAAGLAVYYTSDVQSIPIPSSSLLAKDGSGSRDAYEVVLRTQSERRQAASGGSVGGGGARGHTLLAAASPESLAPADLVRIWLSSAAMLPERVLLDPLLPHAPRPPMPTAPRAPALPRWSELDSMAGIKAAGGALGVEAARWVCWLGRLGLWILPRPAEANTRRHLEGLRGRTGEVAFGFRIVAVAPHQVLLTPAAASWGPLEWPAGMRTWIAVEGDRVRFGSSSGGLADDGSFLATVAFAFHDLYSRCHR
ncbi:uncharacterized protein AMSG_06095 [Thecamonas trahens ATCC 50062]|uniref:Uncharacterized protein n=1 Tax=Thecamonas trahens ATCC 50062 TaxID=461836 RepID=A0A0L0DBU1_THETB|nr:hypothetical protein AMSG_06095 [Thecamonas trahens ATCC 50062]KNC49814.1 hypothetical protein AMSG_06095 [Thecamonas trahens ATCC 50062]|eukprot:XP_013757596.1 hypothetical protein AMSG_06095 [Thecamonas trahens ATCC 50062]